MCAPKEDWTMKSFAMRIYKKSNLQNFSGTFFHCKRIFYCKILKLSFSISICILKLEKFPHNWKYNKTLYFYVIDLTVKNQHNISHLKNKGEKS